MSNAYPSVPTQPPRGAPDGCASGHPVPGSGPGMTPAHRPTTVTHVQYPPAPVAGVPVQGQGFGGFPETTRCGILPGRAVSSCAWPTARPW